MRAFNPFSRPSKAGSSREIDADPSNVLDRLYALFNPAQLETEGTSHPSGDVEGIALVEKQDDADASRVSSSTSPPSEREAIKVFIVTWNMADALVSLYDSCVRGADLNLAAQGRFEVPSRRDSFLHRSDTHYRLTATPHRKTSIHTTS